jgi:hypothetical protein
MFSFRQKLRLLISFVASYLGYTRRGEESITIDGDHATLTVGSVKVRLRAHKLPSDVKVTLRTKTGLEVSSTYYHDGILYTLTPLDCVDINCSILSYPSLERVGECTLQRFDELTPIIQSRSYTRVKRVLSVPDDSE